MKNSHRPSKILTYLSPDTLGKLKANLALGICFIFALSAGTTSLADTAKDRVETPRAAQKDSPIRGKSQKVIDFDGDLVEGMNKRPWDSLNQISDKNKRKKSHLYQKRKGFRSENQEALTEMRYLR